MGGDTINLSGQFPNAIINIKSTLTNVSQSIGALPRADQASKDELRALVDQLGKAIEIVPPDKVEHAEAVASSAKKPRRYRKAGEAKQNITSN
jgi:hypothetical protein